MMDLLTDRARRAARPALAPYSGAPVGAAVCGADGDWLVAPRVESASFPLTIPAVQGVWALASVAGVTPAALALSRPPTAEEAAFVSAVWPHLERVGDAFGACGTLADRPTTLEKTGDADALAVETAARAVVPASDFRVGAAVRDAAGRTVIGANVEHPDDWTRGLCAERVAIVAAHAAGLGGIVSVSVACVAAPGGSPCGGCRQVLAEQARGAEVRIWDGAAGRVTTPEALLPGAFVGDGLGR